MSDIEQTGYREKDARYQSEAIHQVEDAQLPLLVATQRWLISNIFDIALESDNGFKRRVHMVL